MVGMITLAAVGYAVAFIVTGEICRWWREPLRQSLTRLGDAQQRRLPGDTWIPRRGLRRAAIEALSLAEYLLTCRRCLGVESVLVWSLATGWAGWSTTLAAAGLSVLAFEAANRPT